MLTTCHKNLEITRQTLIDEFSNCENENLSIHVDIIVDRIDGMIAMYESKESKGFDFITETLDAIKGMKNE